MSAPAAITASLCDWKNVKTRSVVQLILEIPVEQALPAFQTLGIPTPGKEIPVAVALLNLNSVRQTESGPQSATPQPSLPPTPAAEREGADKPRRAFHELPRSAQAAMLCQNPVFQQWILPGQDGLTPAMSNGVLKARLDIESKRELDVPGRAQKLFDALLARYRSETGQFAEERG